MYVLNDYRTVSCGIYRLTKVIHHYSISDTTSETQMISLKPNRFINNKYLKLQQCLKKTNSKC